MDDPSRFTSINEYYTFIYAISYMMLVELGIWIYNFKGWLKRPDKKNNDSDCNAGVLGKFLFQHLFFRVSNPEFPVRSALPSAVNRIGGNYNLDPSPA